MKKMTCFVTGSSGFIGMNLVPTLFASGDFGEIVLITRKGSARNERLKNLVEKLRSKHPKVECEMVFGDVTDKKSLNDIVPDGCDAFFHLAGDTTHLARKHMTKKQIKVQNSVNIMGTKNAVEVSLAKNVGKFIHVSTVGVYQDGITPYVRKNSEGIQVLDENEPHRGSSCYRNYSSSKFYGQKEVEKAHKEGLFTVIIQPAMVFGKYGDLLEMVYKNKVPRAPTGSNGCIDVEVLCETLLSAYHNGKNGEEYLVGGINAPYNEFVNSLNTKVLGRKKIEVVPYWLLWSVGAACEFYYFCTCKSGPPISRRMAWWIYQSELVDSSKAVRDLGCEFPSIEESCRKWVVWYEKEFGGDEYLKKSV